MQSNTGSLCVLCTGAGCTTIKLLIQPKPIKTNSTIEAELRQTGMIYPHGLRNVAARTNREDLYVYFALEQVVLQTVVLNHEVTCTDEPA